MGGERKVGNKRRGGSFWRISARLLLDVSSRKESVNAAFVLVMSVTAIHINDERLIIWVKQLDVMHADLLNCSHSLADSK